MDGSPLRGQWLQFTRWRDDGTDRPPPPIFSVAGDPNALSCAFRSGTADEGNSCPWGVTVPAGWAEQNGAEPIFAGTYTFTLDRPANIVSIGPSVLLCGGAACASPPGVLTAGGLTDGGFCFDIVCSWRIDLGESGISEAVWQFTGDHMATTFSAVTWFPAPSVDCSPVSVVRGQVVDCHVLTETGITATVTGWSFLSDSGISITRATNPTDSSWVGPLIRSGVVSVQGMAGTVPFSALTQVAATPRDWTGAIPYSVPLPADSLDAGAFMTSPVIDLPDGGQEWPDGQLGKYAFGIHWNSPGTMDLVTDGPNEGVLWMQNPPPGWFPPDVVRPPHLESGAPFYEAQTGQGPGDGKPSKKLYAWGRWCVKTDMDSLRQEVFWHEGLESNPLRISHHQAVSDWIPQHDSGPHFEGVAIFSLDPGTLLDSVIAVLDRAYYNKVAEATDPIVHAASNLFAIGCKAHQP